MSVIDANKVDGIGIYNEGEKLMMLISDHLDWVNEYEHLIKLQSKLNNYISFIENEQYREIYDDYIFNSFHIEIHLQFNPTSVYFEFIDKVNNLLLDDNIFISTQFD